jgi:hypothetical protein
VVFTPLLPLPSAHRPAATMPVNFGYAPLENSGMAKAAERENSATLKHYIDATERKLAEAYRERDGLKRSAEKPSGGVKGWRPYEDNANEIKKLRHHLEKHSTVCTEKLKKQDMDRQHQQALAQQQEALGSITHAASNAATSEFRKVIAIHSTAAKQTEDARLLQLRADLDEKSIKTVEAMLAEQAAEIARLRAAAAAK